MINDVDILGRVEKYHGLTVEDINVGNDGMINVMFQKADTPLPTNISLPKYNPPFIIATLITDDEMKWSQSHGRDELLSELKNKNIGQLSNMQRKSIFYPNGVKYAEITSREKAKSMYELGLLRKAFLFPIEFGGEEIEVNTIYLPKKAAIEKQMFEQKIMQLAHDGMINNYSANPEYKGDSFIPAKLLLKASGKQNVEQEINIF